MVVYCSVMMLKPALVKACESYTPYPVKLPPGYSYREVCTKTRSPLKEIPEVEYALFMEVMNSA